MTRPRSRRRPRRAAPAAPGFALVELLVALTLLGIVLGAVVATSVAQQRAHAALAARRATRAQLRDGALALARELRPLAPPAAGADPGDVRALDDTLVEVLATTGGGVVCARPDARTLELPAGDRDGAAIVWWTAEPRDGDVLLALDAGHDPGAGDDRWARAGVRAVAPAATACAGTPFATGGRGWRVALVDALPATVGAGTPLRFARPRRWTHYRASDGTWQLGLREWDGAGWSETQPVAGPLRDRRTAPGLSVVAVDAAGDPARPADAVAVVAVLRATPAVPWAAGGRPVRPESVVVRVVLRGAAGGTP